MNRARYAAIGKMLLLSLLASACASVTAVQLGLDGKRVTGAAEGIRYFPPKPYLIVAKAPLSVSVTSTRTPDGKTTYQVKVPGDNEDDEPAPAPVASTNTSFGITGNGYALKLIYLPDYEHPMALQVTSGLFGSTTFKPTLQDGWMLTALDVTADNSKLAEALTAVASLVNPAAAATAAPDEAMVPEADAANVPDAMVFLQRATMNILAPGLYEIVFEAGKAMRLRAVATF